MAAGTTKKKGKEPDRSRAAHTAAAEPRTGKPPPVARVAFPKKNHPPTPAEFEARLPAPAGKRFEALRAFLQKQGASEDLFYFGPRTGWAYRYLRGEESVCSVGIVAGRLVGIVSLDAATQAKIAWNELSDVARHARRAAHGTPARLWLDVALDGTGATDFRAILKAKLSSRPTRAVG
jgi:hypothetical protein